MKYNTRFAPSPTGNLHLGGARTALFNYLPAIITGGDFILRIDDTDTVRSRDEYVDDIKRGLDFLGLSYSKVYKQSDRLDLYRSKIDDLIAKGYAVMDTDSSVRLNLPDDLKPVPWIDSIAGEMPVHNKDWDYIKSSVISRAGNMPLYNFVSIVDDIDLGINYIVRGVDHISNTAIQHTLHQILNPDYALKYSHVGLIQSLTGKKMSKRDGDDTFLLSHYIDNGYLPEAMFNCLLRLGWAPKQDDRTTSMLTKDDAIRLFIDGGKLRSAPSKFDLSQLNALNRKYGTRRKHTHGAVN